MTKPGDWRKARRDAERHGLYRMPTPEDVAFHLPAHLADVLVKAKRGRDGYKVPPGKIRDDLFSRGIVAAGGNSLGVFGHAVRRVLVEEIERA